ncbi:hypothetical protein EJ04DRAFT_503614 [Polyplosphaeria fusca]|uniref:Transmembrane protein n=1 Tax=Polyplosphaeria fusca TaxID=682080 RepID=A0A9P4UX81_9PLEO|nr:hypothetical protein EJ04DRAFT_503614 [Polyplosphaeria fusca]
MWQVFRRPHLFAWRLYKEELRYNITRKYPYGKAFKPIVLVWSGLILGALIVFSYGTNGFDKDFQYTTEPNVTESKREWFHNKFFTWGSDNLDPKCQSTDIPVGHEFLTTNLGLRYTVKRILFFPSDSKPFEQRSSISYHNSDLFNCETNDIGIYLRKADGSKPMGGNWDNLWWSWMDSTADAIARCDMYNDEGYFTLEFHVEYKPFVTDYSYLAVENATTHASFWWGARLLNAYFLGTQYVMSGKLPDNNPNTEVYTRTTLSRPFTEGYMVAKIFRSLILADLGNSDAPNLLLEDDLLQYALDSGEDNFNRIEGGPLFPDRSKRDWQLFSAIPPPGEPLSVDTAVPLNQAFEKLRDKTGELGTKTARIYAEYICTVPGPRSKGATVAFTLVSTLALFQAAWALFKYFLDLMVTWDTQKHPRRNWCECCDRDCISQEELEAMQAGPTSAHVGKHGIGKIFEARKSQISVTSSTRALLLDDGNEV